MKLFYLASVLSTILCCSNQAAGQSVAHRTEQKKQVNQSDLPELYKKLIHSQSFIKSEKLMKSFLDKLGNTVQDASMFKGQSVLRQWLEYNVSKTKFKTVDEALTMYKQLVEATALAHKENEAYFIAYANATSDADIMEYAPTLPE